MKVVAGCISVLTYFVFAVILSAAESALEPASDSPSPAVVLYNEGTKLVFEKKFAEAQVKLEAAVAADPLMAAAHNNLAYALRKQGPANFDVALKQYNRAIELNPKLPEPFMYRGVLFIQMGRKADADADLVRLEALKSPLAAELRWVIENGREKEPEKFFGVSKAE